MSGDAWIVLVEDRHCGADAFPFSSEDRAVSAARALAETNARGLGNVDQGAELTAGMRREGWVLYLPYGPEGDCVRVVKRTMDGERP